MKSRYLLCDFMFTKVKTYCNNQIYDYKCQEMVEHMKLLNCHDYDFYSEPYKDDMTWLILHYIIY